MCSVTILKLLLVAINIGFFIVGAVCLGLGLWVTFDSGSIGTILSNLPTQGIEGALPIVQTASTALIIVGCITFIPAFLGCCGGLMKNRLFLVLYAIVVTVFVAAEIAVVALLVARQDEVIDFVKTEANKTLDLYVKGFQYNNSKVELPDSAIDLAWDSIFIQFECCGIAGADHFVTEATNWKRPQVQVFLAFPEANVPASCCKLQDKTKFPSDLAGMTFKFGTTPADCMWAKNTATTNTQGCEDALKAWVKEKFTIIIGVGAAILVLEIIAIACAIIMCRKVSSDED